MKETLCQCQTNQGEKDHTTITMEIPANLLGQLQEAAALAGTDYRALLICYAREGLINSGAQLKRGQFVEHVRDVLEKHGIKANAIEEIFKKILY
ncbi:MAG: hypothetical protein ACD_74C00271G0002 [uncultured bacterium]|nr:MAG: hypothetical protein ACD_74C00271G0002 [uncultured bacterium]